MNRFYLLTLAAAILGALPARAAEASPVAAPTPPDEDRILIDGEEPAATPRDGAPSDAETIEIETPEGPRAPPRTVLTGRLDTKASLDLGFDGAGEDVFDSLSRFELRLELEPDPAFRVALGGRMTYQFLAKAQAGTASSHLYRGALDVELRDAYLFWRTPIGLDIAAGNRVISWGQSDFSQPLNVLNPVDFRYGPDPSGETPLVPVLSLELTQHLGPVNLSAVWIPLFVPHRVSLFGSDWALAGPELGLAHQEELAMVVSAIDPTRYEEVEPILLSTQDPPQDPVTGSDVGVRMTANLDYLDLGLAYAYQWDRVPVIERDDVAIKTSLEGLAGGLVDEAPGAALRAAYKSHYERRHVVGADAAVSLGDFNIKTDVVLSYPRTFYYVVSGEDPVAVRKPSIYYAIQADYVWFPFFNVSVEFSHMHVFDVPEGQSLVLVDRDLMELAAFIQGRIGTKGEFTLTLSGRYGVTLGDFVFTPSLHWRVTDYFSLAAGAALFFATGPSLGRLYEKNDYAYLQSTLSF